MKKTETEGRAAQGLYRILARKFSDIVTTNDVLQTVLYYIYRMKI